MASPKLSTLVASVCAAAMIVMIPSADAQLLPDIGGGLSDVLNDVDRGIEDRLEHDLDAELEDVLDGDRVLDGIGRIVGSAEVGNTLEETLQTLGDVSGALNGIIGMAGVPPGRSIELDELDGWPVVRNEWVVLVPAGEAAAVEALDVEIVERTDLTAVDRTLFIVSLTATAATAQAVEAELASLGADPFDRNHVFRGAAEMDASVSSSSSRPQPQPVPVPMAGSLRIGLVDTDVDETHPSLAGVDLYEADFVSLGELRPQGHGTAVASIMARQTGARNDATRELLAASAFFLGNDGTTGATSASLIQAIDWLQANGADVINVSLTGPPNRALEAIIQSSQTDGTVFVAAVGNEGPASGPLYPAAYDGVIGVSAVDAAGAIYRWANRGGFVDVAARGVDVLVAKPGGAEKRDSGTSFAAPVVSAFLGGWTQAKRIEAADPHSLIRASVSGGAPDGRDDTFGYGILVPTGARASN